MWTKRLVAYFLVVVLWAVISVSPHVATSVAAVAPSALHRVAAPSVADFLQPDGTLDLPTGFAGGLDPTGYQLISAPSGTLRFAPSDPGDEYWADGFGYPGVSSYVNALTVDGQGNLYAGGRFTTAGGVSTNYIARWDGSAWHTLGSGMDSWVSALAVDGQGNLYAGGYFTTAGGESANRIARWDGSAWHALGSGMNDGVAALAVDGQGNLYAGGLFTTAGGVSANYIARWDGSAWHPLGSGMVGSWDPSVSALAVDGHNDLYAGGQFTNTGGVDANYIARWDGSAWHPLRRGVEGAYPTVWALAFDGQGNPYVGGNFTSAGDQHARNIARWDGSAWHILGSGVNYFVYTLAPDRQGNVYAGGKFTYAGSIMTPYVARWDGSAWHSLGSGMWGYRPYPYVNALAVDGQRNLYVGGSFKTVGGKPSSNIALWIGEAVRYRSFSPFVPTRYSTLAP